MRVYLVFGLILFVAELEGVSAAQTQKQTLHRLQVTNALKEVKVNGLKMSGNDNELNKGLEIVQKSNANSKNNREPEVQHGFRYEMQEYQKKKREMALIRKEKGLPSRPFMLRINEAATSEREDLRSILNSPKRDEFERNHLKRQKLKEKFEQHRKEMQIQREQRVQMNMEERRSLRKKIRETSQDMEPPPRR